MNYALEKELGTVTWIPSFIEIGLGIQKLIGADKYMGTLTKRKAIS
jgi:hypothetical protein